MDHPPRKRLADLTALELQQRAAKYRRMAVSARCQDIASALNRLAIRFARLAAHREVEETAQHRETLNESRNHTELAKLVVLANRAAACEPDPMEALVSTIRSIVPGDADPYLVVGTLLEGAVHAICTRIPNERLEDTAEAAIQLLKHRLQANGLVQGTP